MTNKARKSTLDLTGLPTTLPAGGTVGQVLKKLSGTDYDVGWQSEIGLDSLRANVPAVPTVNLTAINSRNILLTGAASITGFQILAGNYVLVSCANSGVVLKQGANLNNNNRGLDLYLNAGDSFILRAIVDNTVEVLALSQNPVGAFSAYANADQGIVSGVTTAVVPNIVQFDTNVWYNTITGKFLPTVPGYYQFNGTIRFAGTNYTFFTAILLLNGAEYKRGEEKNIVANSSQQQANVSDIILLNGSTDYVQLAGSIVGTTPTFKYGGSSAATSRFSGSFVRRT